MRITLACLDLIPVSGYPHYFADRDGSIWSDWKGWLRYLRPVTMNIGYLQLELQVERDGRKIPVKDRVHAMVCATFHGPRPSPQHQCRHLNGVRNDNRAENLAWGTASENKLDCNLHGTMPHGEKHWKNKLAREDVRQILLLKKAGQPQIEIAEKFGVSPKHISRICRGESWKWLESSVEASL
jgi:hypothetical protein